jgi:cobyrinic acid a,c-diamide synthase
MELLEESGAQLVFFSPLEDRALPSPIDALYLGGGYPELYAARLSGNSSMRKSVKTWAKSGGKVYAECGGLMYLSRSIVDFDDHVFAMAGVFPFQTRMARGRAHLGYREAFLKNDCILGSAGQSVRGHEFHYSTIENPEKVRTERTYRVKDGSACILEDEGYLLGNTLGSYIHVHFGSNPSIARSFTEFARQGRAS